MRPDTVPGELADLFVAVACVAQQRSPDGIALLASLANTAHQRDGATEEESADQRMHDQEDHVGP